MRASALFPAIWLAALALAVVSFRSIFASPPAQLEAGALAQKIFYIHVSSAWTAFFAFILAAACSVGHLISESTGEFDVRGKRRALSAFSAVEVGFMFCSVVLVTGPIWARPVWGVWWRWEPRLTTFLILWATYAAALLVRSSIDRPALRDRVFSVYAILAAVEIPIVYASVLFWKPESQFHPPTIQLAADFLRPLWMTMAMATVLFFALWILRTRICRMEEGVA